MAATATSPARPRLTRRPARSARLRLTLLYSGMFLALGTVIIVVIFLIGRGNGAVAVTQSAFPTQKGPGGGPVLKAVVSQQHTADVNRLLVGAWVTLALTAAVSTVLGWFLAGSVLRPLRQMTATARTISSGNLHERLGVTGPDDEFKQLGDTVDELLARLEASFAAQRRFVANAAHELRTPLTVERALLQVALADPDASAKSLRATCEELLASGRDQERLLEALLTLATSERGLEDRRDVDLADVVERVLPGLRDDLEAKGVDLRTDLRAAVVLGDSALLGRLVANLLENAVHYNRPDGVIEVRTGNDSERATVAVSNTGPVVPTSEVGRLFEPFQRLGPQRTASDGSHGLGLSIVRAIATAHDAEVTAEARPEGGLNVTVSFPSRGGHDPSQ